MIIFDVNSLIPDSIKADVEKGQQEKFFSILSCANSADVSILPADNSDARKKGFCGKEWFFHNNASCTVSLRNLGYNVNLQCKKFTPNSASFIISHDTDSRCPEIKVAGRGKVNTSQKGEYLILNTESLELTFYAGGVYKVQNFTGTDLSGSECGEIHFGS